MPPIGTMHLVPAPLEPLTGRPISVGTPELRVKIFKIMCKDFVGRGETAGCVLIGPMIYVATGIRLLKVSRCCLSN